MYKLKIDLQSFQFTNGIIQENDTVRVSITTLPDERKQALTIDAKKLKNFHHFFTISITDQTQRILFVVRKKIFSQNDPIIASSIVLNSQLPKPIGNADDTELKNIFLYEPIQHSCHSNISRNVQKRKILGQMQVQFSIFPIERNFVIRNRACKTRQKQGFSKRNPVFDDEAKFNYVSSENLICN